MRNPEETVNPLIDPAALEQALRGDVKAVKAFRDALKAANDRLAERFRRNEAVDRISNNEQAVLFAAKPRHRPGCAADLGGFTGRKRRRRRVGGQRRVE